MAEVVQRRVGPFYAGVGPAIALIVLVVVIILFAIGKMDGLSAGLIGALAAARLLP